jgi:hypothetical protein
MVAEMRLAQPLKAKLEIEIFPGGNEIAVDVAHSPLAQLRQYTMGAGEGL